MCLRDRECFLKVSVEEESASIGLAWFHGPWKFTFYTRDIFVWRTIGRIGLVKVPGFICSESGLQNKEDTGVS